MGLPAGQQTITFDELYNAWTSFHSYVPEWMERLGNRFYTFKGGELYVHDENNTRTNFYGTTYGCSITYSSNQSPSDIKLFKTIGLETNSDGWWASLSSDLEVGFIGSSNNLKFQDKEGIRYSYIRRASSDKNNYNKLSVLGIGELQVANVADTYGFSVNIPNQVSANNADGQGGDELWVQVTSGGTGLVGIVDSFSGQEITVDSTVTTPSIGDFCFIVKNSESESYGLRGYHAEITLFNNQTSFVELYGANAEVFKSYM